ncbi:MAG TPA: HAD-IA family hydrolase [Verrucomicrobiae bacterium]|jgi:putative hydrolase of the HAD superfamily|nr:HAD-IA family hydrolase [Verrucomicrobiae bacterium]
MLNSYEVICFDAGGTLFTPHPSVGEIYSEVALKYGCRAEPLHIEEKFRALWHKRDISGLVSLSDEKVEKEWWRTLVAEVFRHFPGVNGFDAFFEELYVEFAGPSRWKLFPETMHVLQELKGRKKKLCVISNWDSRLLHLCEGLGLSSYFEFILISAVFGASKPSPKIFREALRRWGVDPSRAVHIGDSLEDDVRGAKGAGMDAVLIDRAKRKHAEPHHFEGVTVIHDLKELL